MVRACGVRLVVCMGAGTDCTFEWLERASEDAVCIAERRCTWSVVTAERDNPRPVGEKEPFCCDCTHYGYYPQLWQHFWHGLWHALVEAPGMPKPARG